MAPIDATDDGNTPLARRSNKLVTRCACIRRASLVYSTVCQCVVTVAIYQAHSHSRPAGDSQSRLNRSAMPTHNRFSFPTDGLEYFPMRIRYPQDNRFGYMLIGRFDH